jgi:hypothetical protein
LCQCHLELEKAQKPSSLYLGYFLCKKISITLQSMETSSILNQAVHIGLTISQLPSLHHAHSITITNPLQANLLQAIDF